MLKNICTAEFHKKVRTSLSAALDVCVRNLSHTASKKHINDLFPIIYRIYWKISEFIKLLYLNF